MVAAMWSGSRLTNVLMLLALAGLPLLVACGRSKAPEETRVDREAWTKGLGEATARALALGDIEAIRPFLPSDRDCAITRQKDAYRMGKWVCAVHMMEEGFTKPFYEAVKALSRRPLADVKATSRIGPDPDADPKASEWQRRLELVYRLPEQSVAVFWTVAEYEDRYLIIGPPVVGQPSL